VKATAPLYPGGRDICRALAASGLAAISSF
jgi:hypothetical protein